MKRTLTNIFTDKAVFIQTLPYLFLGVVLPFTKTLISLGVILIVFAWLINGNWDYKRNQVLRNRNILVFSLFFILHVISLAYSENINYGGSQIVKYLSLIIFPIVCGSSLYLTKKLKHLTLVAFVSSCFLASVFCLGFAFYRNYTISEPKTLYYSFEANFGVKGGPSFIHWDYFSYKELISVLNLHPTYFSLFLVIAIFFLIDLLDNKDFNFGKKKFWIFLHVIFFVFFLFLLSARIIILTFIFLLTLYLFRASSKRFGRIKSLLLTFSVIVISLGCIYALPITRYRLFNEIDLSRLSVPGPNEDVGTGLKMRLVHWHSALQVINDNLLFGCGVGDFQEALDTIYRANGYQSYLGFNAHNQYLQTVLIIGLVGLISLLLIFYLSFHQAIKTRDGLYFCFLFIFGVTCITESLLQSQKGIIFFSFFNCLFFFTNQNSRSSLEDFKDFSPDSNSQL